MRATKCRGGEVAALLGGENNSHPKQSMSLMIKGQTSR
jgi:hypothetical protein